MNLLFFFFIAIAVIAAAWAQLSYVPGPETVAPLTELTNAAMEAGKLSVTLSIGLVGAMAFFLGLVKVAEAGGLLGILARLIRPLMVLLFPDVPPNHPAMGAMILNMSANALGLGNAATPFGIRAMQELDKLNAEKGTATNAMALFLAINTSSVTLLPTGAMIWRQNLGSTDMAGILPTTLFATACSTMAAIAMSKLLSRFSAAPKTVTSTPEPTELAPELRDESTAIESPPPSPDDYGPLDYDEATAIRPDGEKTPSVPSEPIDPVMVTGWVAIAAGLLLSLGGAVAAQPIAFLVGAPLSVLGACVTRWRSPDGRDEDAMSTTEEAPYPIWVSIIALIGLFALIPIMIVYGQEISPWVVPGIIIGFLGFGFARGVNVYEKFVVGAKEAFDIAVMIIPYLVAILVSIAMLRASGALEAFIGVVGPYTEPLGLPAEALPMALLRPLSGSGANGIMIETMQANGPDTYIGYLVSTLQGSTETTFYVIAVYFGAVNVRRIRHTLAAALTADIVGVIAAVAICSYLYGTL